MKRNINTKEKAQQFRTAWAELAPNDSLGGMTLAQFIESILVLDTLQSDIDALKAQLGGKRTERAIEEARVRDVLELVASSIKGSPQHGRDSALYSGFGFVRLSNRKSGLHRKSAMAPVVTPIVPSGIIVGGNNGTGGSNAA
jgi:hypothetical protein